VIAVKGKNYGLTVKLMSDATFGRGEGLAGLVDTEIEHDEHGCPFIGGRTLKGLLCEEWRNIRDALESGGHAHLSQWNGAAQFLFGVTGDTTGDGTASMHIGAATLPPALLRRIHDEVQSDPSSLTAAKVLASLTTLRRQTAVDIETDAPATGSLRSERALIRNTYLFAPLTFEDEPEERHLALLAACVLAVRRGGLGRNRGRGRVQLRLHEPNPASYDCDYDDEALTRRYFDQFVCEVRA
jgi:hypothetical protein